MSTTGFATSLRFYVEGDVHANAIEGFWGLVKRSVTGVFHQVGPHYLQHYVNEYSFVCLL